MPPRRTAPLRGKARVGAQHVDWLTLIEPAGQFLTLPVLRRTFPDGLPQLDAETRREARERAASMDWASTAEATGWIEYLLREVCRWGPRLRTGPQISDQIAFRVPEHGAMLRPEYLLANADGSPRVLVDRHPAGTPLDRRLAGDRWAASPIDRLGVLCRALGVTVGVVTNGREFAVVYAPAGSVGGHATFDAALFAEGAEANLLTAFAALLGALRFFAAAGTDTLEALLLESASSQADVTNMLGLHVRRAVELLVSSISRANLEADGTLLAGVAPQRVYEASATVIMRLVFLLYAEERNLLPLGEQLYDDNSAVCTLYDQLAEASDRFGDEPLELRSSAWQRLLAMFRAVSAGIDHDRLRMPPYGGGLFDPDRFAFLEGRTDDQPWQVRAAHPLPVDDLTVREILRALQFLTTTQAGATESRRLSFRTLDVEQIGHIYEGTLDHAALMAQHNVVGLIGKQGIEPEVVLRDLEQAGESGRLLAFLTEQTGRSAQQLRKLLDTPLDAETERRLRTATHNDADLTRRIAPYAHLLREDLRGLPIVFVPGSIYVTETTARRDTGTEYTPRELAEEIVTGALEPLVYAPGPAQGVDRADWVLRPSAQILALRVCDPAVGSGAILVAACRYLADRLLEAWQVEGAVPAGYRPARTVVADEDELLVMARRAVADRCLRLRNNDKGARDYWWRFLRPRPEMLAAITGLERVIVITLVSSVVQPARVPGGQVLAHKLGVFASESVAFLGLLARAVHGEWVRRHASSLETRINYSPSDVFETFPFPPSLAPLEAPGLAMETARHAVMHGRTIGLTPTYNLINTPTVTDDDVVALRQAHVALDEAVLAAYGWPDLALDHGFHDTAQGRRFTIGPAARVELLDRLLELNHRRYAEEVAAGLHAKAARRSPGTRQQRRRGPPSDQPLEGLF